MAARRAQPLLPSGLVSFRDRAASLTVFPKDRLGEHMPPYGGLVRAGHALVLDRRHFRGEPARLSIRRKLTIICMSMSFSRGARMTWVSGPSVTLTLPLSSSVTVLIVSRERKNLTPLDVSARRMTEDLRSCRDSAC